MKNHFLPLSLGVLLTLSSAAAIAQNAATTSNNNAAQVTAPETQKNVGEILKDVVVINSNEINAAKFMLQNSQNADVKNFAQHMEANHSQNRKMALQLSEKLHMPLVDSDKSKTLAADGKTELEKLQTLQGKDLDIAYMDAMVAGHQAVLNAIDQDFLPMATKPQVVAFLKNTRAKVEEHLNMAKTVRGKLG